MMCGNDQNIILPGTPYLVANDMYGASSFASGDSACTSFDSLQGSSVVWSAQTSIQNVEATDEICKGYANVGFTSNLNTPISSISSIPARYTWSRTTTTPFRGNIIFDFILSPNQGDSTSTAAQELMLWLDYEGGQVPIGYDAGVTQTINLYGTSFNLYEGVNTGNGMTVHSLIVEKPLPGTFSGDLKDWFEAMVSQGAIPEGAFMNVGNAGSEIFYGDSTLQATVDVQVNVTNGPLQEFEQKLE
ncbi:MAG: hypothetical protein M1828_005123 [Chrysothrix sp. TS-e1954]|nr:MAG: hypothetical protein M1828_005123 [Chrysothrix sp. TS-e1954]